MPYAAIMYRIDPGHEDELAEIFADFKRVNSSVLRSADGNILGRLLGTAVFVKDEFMVRIIHYEGDFRAIGKHMSTQTGVMQAEQRLAPFLTHRRPATSSGEFKSNFQAALMTCVSHLSDAQYANGEAIGVNEQ